MPAASRPWAWRMGSSPPRLRGSRRCSRSQRRRDARHTRSPVPTAGSGTMCTWTGRS
ncbi:hypothetical protein [Ornithinimicrobium kibberense]|uniref:hypothetical protein n=1 Tax=Ornithinimicrobium kibberense TaxID=282060 RepID=UPI0036066113